MVINTMENRENIVIGLMLLFLSVSCLREETTLNNSNDSSFLAIMENPVTKAHIEDDGRVEWSVYDQIGVFSDQQTSPEVYRRDESDGLFKGVIVPGRQYYSYYPSWGFYQDANNPLLLSFGVQGWVGRETILAPMIAISTNKVLCFKQTCGLLHIRLRGTFCLEHVELKGNNNERIGGKTFIDLSETTPTIRSVDPNGSISIACLQEEQEDGEWDFFFVVPDLEFSNGFTLKIHCRDKESNERFVVSKTTYKRFSISRGQMVGFPIIDIDELRAECLTEIQRENAILKEMFNKTDGNNWSRKEGWGTDSPDWYGIRRNEEGFVTRIVLANNNLCGSLPEAVWGLPYLEELSVNNNNLLIRIPTDENKLSPHLTKIRLGNYDMIGVIDEGISTNIYKNNQIVGGLPKAIGVLSNLVELSILKCGVTGVIPDELWSLPNLEFLYASGNSLSGSLTPAIGNAKKLKELNLANNTLSGIIPEELCEMESLESIILFNDSIDDTGHLRSSGNHLLNIPSNIGKLSNLVYLGLSNLGISGGIPKSLYDCSRLEYLTLGNDMNNLGYYNFYGEQLSEDFGRLTNLYYMELSGSGIYGSIPCFINNLPNLYYLGLQGSVNGDYITNVFNEGGTFQNVGPRNGIIGELPELLLSNELCINVAANYLTGNIPVHYAYLPGLFLQAQYNCLSGKIPEDVLNASHFSQFEIIPQRDGFGFEFDLYESKDYSHDGNIKVIQRATKGKGIDIVIMGDAFADYEIADGTYDSYMNQAVNNLFSIEPYASFKEYFNVYEIEVVSKNNVYQGQVQDTALDTYFGVGTMIEGNDNLCRKYAEMAIPDTNRQTEMLVIILLNRKYYAGTCYMYHVFAHDEMGVDYGNGPSFAYLPLGTDDNMFRGLVLHEVGGHGFAKLADEYFSEDGFFNVSDYQSVEDLNWFPNIDITSDTNIIKWKEFINDDRYKDEHIGVYEGGATVINGVWRPTEYSIMRYNTGDYNAPSREAIYKRIHKLAFGQGWELNYEDFVNYDLNVRSQSSARNDNRIFLNRHYPPLTPPVVKNGFPQQVGAVSGTQIPELSISSIVSQDDKRTNSYTYQIGNMVYKKQGNIMSTYTIAPKENDAL